MTKDSESQPKRNQHKRGFAKVFRDAIDRYRPIQEGDPAEAYWPRHRRLTWYQLGVLTGLIATIGRHDTIVRHDDGMGPPMTISDIAEYIGCNRRNAYETLRALERAGAIRLHGSTRSRYVEIMPYVANRYTNKPANNS